MECSENKNKERKLSNSDHRVLGEQLDLFSISEEVGVGLVLWHPKGVAVRRIVRDFWEEEHLKNGYQLVCTPHIAKGELWKVSGHLDYYAQNMYLFEKEGESYVVKPMNCPFHIQIYKAKPRSYKDLPIRYAEWGTVYRYEPSGTLHGLLRVRGFTQDDAHIFCTAEQIDDEIVRLLDFAERILRKFGFKKYNVYLSTRDPKQPRRYMGSEEKWQIAQKALANALRKKSIAYREMQGEAVFYGPKIDINIVDASGREWQCSTIQFDFNLPKRFNVTYTSTDGGEHEALMIHRALLGAIERFFAIIIEHYKGNLPTWLASTQVRILPISDKQLPYAQAIHKKLQACGVRTEIDSSASTINYKIREAETRKIPYMAICGEREAKSKQLSIRRHEIGNIGTLTVKELVEKIRSESI
ncbi:threonine--tRNA ligase [Candidatus Bathyarchaeota archaeon]|nr:threonine--tRNA ligase [Candidatus Bathyarchaeota archaeon]